MSKYLWAPVDLRDAIKRLCFASTKAEFIAS